MDPGWACVVVPALPLQILLRQHPEWAGLPVVVVDQDRPQGKILWANEAALGARIVPGRRYAEGRSLAADLRAGVVDSVAIQATVDEVLTVLRGLSPAVEPCAGDCSVFWVDVKGLDEARRAPGPWLTRLRQQSLVASAVVGFSRFGTYALARSHRGVLMLASPEQERQRAAAVPLHRLGWPPELRDALAKLGVTDVGGFRALPAQALRTRYGEDAFRWHRLAHDALPAPLVAAPEVAPVRAEHWFDPDQHGVDATALLFLLKPRLQDFQQQLAPQGKAIAALQLRLLLDGKPPLDARVQPAVPTLDDLQLLDLLRLRLGSLTLSAEITGFELHAEVVAAHLTQGALFVATTRNLAAGNRALARVRAELGDDAVVHAVLRAGHLPQARFAWQRFTSMCLPAPQSSAQPRFVRRILAAPRVLAHTKADQDGWFIHGLSYGPVVQLEGPYIVSGGWWHHEQRREYYFATTQRGDVLWVYRDRVRRLWCIEGWVE